ncbi:hypothetical protein BKA65DRAFT_543093 [Rhexocercosporidium sp. MPI-PUGE-AT-0058]|nr:hypothetical protein BKA65DRAFT_543093 [Rhexocercosporidium sp. MPI-PUGE-AT-0058]
MAEIYSEAYLTIAATSASNCQVGCFTQRGHRINHGAEVQYSSVKSNSARYLTWGISESIRLATAGTLDPSTALPDPLKGWFGVDSVFSKLEISFESDRLPAISGLATAMSKHFKKSYIAGIWGAELAQGLLWSKYRHQQSIRVRGMPKFGVPTWTWASMELILSKGDGLMSSRGYLRIDPLFRSPSFDSLHTVMKPIVSSDEAAIKAQGKTIMCILRHRYQTFSDGYPEHELMFRGETSYLDLDVTCKDDKGQEIVQLEVLCLLLATSQDEFYP